MMDSFFVFLFILFICSISLAKPNNSKKSNISTVNFLESYGYLPKMRPQDGENLISHEELKNAIRLMQKYANIPETGKIDELTKEVMRSPRCGMPDVTPEYRRPRRNKRFVVYGPKWTKSPITWSFNHPSRSVPTGTARQVFHKAFDLWAQASHKLRFVETSDPKADILIGFYAGDHGCGSRQSFDGPGIKLAHAFAPPNGDVHFDDDEDWVGQKNGLNLYWTALHEFGHSLGFAHTADESSIMFPYYRDHGKNFQLPEVDKAGVRYLYGDLGDGDTTEEKLPLPSDRPILSSSGGDTTTTDQPNVDNYICNTNIDAIASIRNEIFVFKNKSFWWIKNDLVMIRKDPILISQYFVGFPPDIDHVDAVYERRSDQMIMFFVGRNYWLFNANQYAGGPFPLTKLGLPPQIDSVDAVTNWGRNGRAYIFTGPVYWRMDANEEQVEDDYPRDLGVWRGVPINIDAAFTWSRDSATYFFKGEYYWKFNNEKMRTTSDRPERIRDFLFRSVDCSRIVNADRRSIYSSDALHFQGRSSSSGFTAHLLESSIVISAIFFIISQLIHLG